jgi:hypothetical protein
VGSGTFVKVDRPYKLTESNTIISFGDTHMIIKIIGEACRIKFVDGPRAQETFTFTSKATPFITIGRMHDCTIVFESNALSRYQSTVKWD